MTTDEDDDQQAYTSACVRTALKRYTRRRQIKGRALMLMVFIGALTPWFFEDSSILGHKFEGSNILVWYVGILVVLVYAWTEQRLRTMQIRLATMHDLLHRIAGDSPDEQDELLMELVAEVGPVDPEPAATRRRASVSPTRQRATPRTVNSS
jgi:hypothetical protein